VIIAECLTCEAPIWYGYEAGDEPCGVGVYGRHTCEKCGARNYIERVSFGGRVMTEAEMIQRSGGDLESTRVSPRA
jgi:hypothetical protein